MKDTERKELFRQYAKLALANLRDSGGKTATPEMETIQQQLNMTHKEILSEDQKVTIDKL